MTYGVCSCKPTRLETQARQQRVSFDDRLKGGCQSLRLVRLVRLLPELEQDFLAFRTDGLGQVCWEQSAEIRTVPRLTGLDVGRKSIADTGSEEACGGLDHDAGVNEDKVRVFVVESVVLEFSAGSIDDGESGAWSIGGGSGGEDCDG